MMDPGRLRKWLIFVAVGYLLLPRDLIPDFMGRGLGYIEDLLLIALLSYAYRQYRRRYAARATTHDGQSRQREKADAGTTNRSERSFDPYRILGVSPSATMEDIQAAYKARMAEYHPDKVAHLGEELQKLAHEKALEIQRAYEQLSA
jgi:DnaJ-domain-containing protein 1